MNGETTNNQTFCEEGNGKVTDGRSPVKDASRLHQGTKSQTGRKERRKTVVFKIKNNLPSISTGTMPFSGNDRGLIIIYKLIERLLYVLQVFLSCDVSDINDK